MKKIIPILLLMALAAAGCSTAMVPVGKTNYPAGSMSVDLIVGQRYPSFDRGDPYTPLYVTFRNNTSKKVQLKYAYFTLLDPDGREFVIAPVREVVDWIRYDRWRHYYAPYYPAPVGRYVFREGRLAPGAELQAVVFFHQAARFGQGTYTLRAAIPENGQPMEFTFRLK